MAKKIHFIYIKIGTFFIFEEDRTIYLHLDDALLISWITKNIFQKKLSLSDPPKLIWLQNAVGQIKKKNLCSKIESVGRDEIEKKVSVLAIALNKVGSYGCI